MPVKGKIVEIETRGEGEKKRFYHQMVLMSKDQFSQPAGIVVGSKKMLGTEDQVIELDVEYSGFVKRGSYTDKNTGELKEFKELKSYFIEAVA